MYEAHYGLKEKPFSLIPDPDFLFLGRSHKMALSLLKYGLADQTGFTVITGDVGTGKTSLIRQLLRTAGKDLTVGLIASPLWSASDLLRWILLAFGLRADKHDLPAAFQGLLDYLIGQYAEGKRTILIIDEAQTLDGAGLEILRLLSNVNVDKHFLLQTILLGQLELKATLGRAEQRRFVQRMSVFYQIEPLSSVETIAYIRHRLRVAGGDPQLFETRAAAAVHYFAGGVPRLINVLSDLALVFGFAAGRPTIDIETVLDAVQARQAGGLDAFQADGRSRPRAELRAVIEKLLPAPPAASPPAASPTAASPADVSPAEVSGRAVTTG